MNTIWTFSQGEHLPRGNRGVCMQLVAYWVSLMSQDKSENAEATKTLETLCKQEAQKLQRAYGKVAPDADKTAGKEAVTWALRGLKLSSAYKPLGGARELGSEMDDKRCGYSIGIYFARGGGHALGAWRSGRSSGLLSKLSGHVYFFDPNFGCYKGNSSDFANWVVQFLNDKYPDCNAYEIAKVEPRQAPAPGAFSYT